MAIGLDSGVTLLTSCERGRLTVQRTLLHSVPLRRRHDKAWPKGRPLLLILCSGEAINLAVGLAIAIPSGIGVALSVLGNNTGSLVGVAISASLLPPAVNCGLNWGFALISAAKSDTRVDGACVWCGNISFVSID